MDSTRQQKIARLIQKDLGEIFQQQSKAWFNNALITVTMARITKDLSIARVYLSIFAINGINADDVLKEINIHNTEIRHLLGTRIKNQVRIIPHLQFFVDDSLDYLENIENLLKS